MHSPPLPLSASPSVILIKPMRGWVPIRFRELFEYRDLFYFLVWRDIKVRYKQTVLGAAWAVLQPLLTMVVFTIFFGKFAKMPSDGLPYPVFAYCALVPWQLFAYALGQSSNSLVGSQNLITKVYFPRLVIPIASVVGGLLDFAIAFLVLIVIMFLYGVVPTAAILMLPLLVLLTILSALAVGLWLSALNVEYRDVRYTIPFLTQIWLFSTPIAYPTSIVPEWLRPLYGINPMVGVVDGFRWALLGAAQPSWQMLSISTLSVVLLLVGGLLYFRRMERTFADVV